jgi:FKBP-type peptidyl-prolyl cis-trans isomerase
MIFFVTVAALSFGTAYTKDVKKASAAKKTDSKDSKSAENPIPNSGLVIKDEEVGKGASAQRKVMSVLGM